jgi:hypothetical protein
MRANGSNRIEEEVCVEPVAHWNEFGMIPAEMPESEGMV